MQLGFIFPERKQATMQGPTQLGFDGFRVPVEPFKSGLLKWIGNKQRFAHEIVAWFPSTFERYMEPFVGSGAVLATLAPPRAIASDCFGPLVEIWQTLSSNPELLKLWYAERWLFMQDGEKVEQYKKIKASYNAKPNGADLLFLCRSCYGGVVRFRQADGYMSTPCGIHDPIHPQSFGRRVDEWARRTAGTQFFRMGYQEAMENARAGDLVYCDPPYSNSQGILYGAQAFDLTNLFRVMERCKARGVKIALSIDGTKKSGKTTVKLPMPRGLFEEELFIDCGRSMLKRFQMDGQTLEQEVVTDRLLLTY
ncbi:MAG: Dam family site-specific DNA-(adenine-N6)-methyltransferase [Bryobacterales bacterium]|nr:Dam family site-specific DNA-(adenine-N6)-methyltransferase [Bryobacterales bacterium]